MSIRIGTQLIVPNGYQNLSKGVLYYYLRSDPDSEKVTLVEYIKSPTRKTRNGKPVKNLEAQYRVLLWSIPRYQFELGREGNEIILNEHQSTMPPWLVEYEGRDLSLMDTDRPRARTSHIDRIETRLKHIGPLLEIRADILNSKDPERAVNLHAKKCKPIQHSGRLRLWFFTYLLFGANKFALHYSATAIGRWARDSAGRVKRGAPSKYNGKGHGYNVDDQMREKIAEGFERFGRTGYIQKKIYQLSMQYVFGCRIKNDQRGKKYFHPEGSPFPSLSQFFDVVAKKYGETACAEIKMGKGRARTELHPSKGNFTQAVCNLMQRVESDGYFFTELPRGYVEGSPLGPLCMVHIRDVASGAFVGVGFSLGSERASTYRMAMFCAAIDKVKFCSLFGLVITPEEWPMIGLPLKSIMDRGPGATDAAHADNPEFRPVMREMAPSYSGQSKAVIESSHLKTASNEDAPSYVVSGLTPALMIKREILATIQANDTMLVQNRITPDLINKVRQPTPNGLWNAMSALGRNDAQPISFEDAVRAFLSRVPAKVKSDGVYVADRRYDSNQLRETKILERVARAQGLDIEAYHHDGSVRYIWIQVNGLLVEVELQFGLNIQDETKNVSLEELKQWQRVQREQRFHHKEHVNASATAMNINFKEQTGANPDSSTKRKGHAPRKTPIAKREFNEAKQAHEGKAV